jgi:2-hydroxy-6-oxonona-2,4-dienedioate hydrolase
MDASQPADGGRPKITRNMTIHSIPNTISDQDDIARLQAAATRETTPCGSGQLVWRIWGKNGTPVVLLHGGSGSWIHWVRNIGALVKAGHVVYVPDLPGFGESDIAPEAFDADGQAEWVALGIQQFLGDRPYDLVGFSFGSMVATFLAVQYPQQVRRLVVVGAPALTEEPVRRVNIQSWRPINTGIERYAAHKHNIRTLMLAKDESVEDYIVKHYGTDAENDRIPQRRLFKTDILRQKMPYVRCPVWGIWGAQDVLYLGVETSVLAGLSRAPYFQALTQIPSAGHWVQYEGFRHFNRDLLAILETETVAT